MMLDILGTPQQQTAERDLFGMPKGSGTKRNDPMYQQSAEFERRMAQQQQEQLAARAAQYAKSAEEEQAFYDQQMGGLYGMREQATADFARARAPLEGAVAALGQRAGTLEGGTSMQALQQSREAAQARAMVAARTAFGGKGASPEAAILGGQIGQTQAAGMGALEQEAAAREAAYLRGIGAIGTGLMGEAEERRLQEAEILKDMQTRFIAAQAIAAQKDQAAAARRQAELGQFATAVGGGLGLLVGGPAGATVGAKIGKAVGG